MRALTRDPERTDLVFVVIRALAGDAAERVYRRVMADPVGRRILEERRSLLATLSRLDDLRALPADTLGHAYAAFMDSQGLSAGGLVEASRSPTADDEVRYLDDRARCLGERLRDMHDLWHVVTGYNRDLVGEAALLAFSWAQTRNRGVGLIVLVALARLWRFGLRDGVRTVLEGHRRGRRAAFLPAADWEALLGRPLVEVRRTLHVLDVPAYTELWRDAPAPQPG